MSDSLLQISVSISSPQGHRIRALGKCKPEHVEQAATALAAQAARDIAEAENLANAIVFSDIIDGSHFAKEGTDD